MGDNGCCTVGERTKSLASLAYIPVRLVLGILFVAHGGQKLFGLFGGDGFAATVEGFGKMGFVPATFWAALAGGAEFFGGIAVLIGLLTRWGALGIAIVMTVAVFKVHWANGLMGPGGFEHALACFAMALTLVFGGAGPWLSIDSLLCKKK